ncbi:AMP-binding protein [Variovorax sp. GT1P44]|uniref:AMP-binding protein n=1 Tax=Variovorax sp. GT1P44 TaxID=3443742 RepID=UPI003F4620F2
MARAWRAWCWSHGQTQGCAAAPPRLAQRIPLCGAARRVSRRGVWATAMPLFHVGGCAGSQLGAMTSRGTFVLQTAFEPGGLLSIIESERVNHLHAVPAMVLKILEHPELPRRDVSSLRTLMSGGSQVPASLVERARRELGCRFTITFGQTELCGVVSQTYPGDSLDRQTSTIGQPAPWMEVKVADPDSGMPRQLGETSHTESTASTRPTMSDLKENLMLGLDDLVAEVAYARRHETLGRLALLCYCELRPWARRAQEERLAELTWALSARGTPGSRARFLRRIDVVIEELEEICRRSARKDAAELLLLSRQKRT